jgi:hypothetical protein
MDEIAKAYVTLSSLKQNAPTTFEIDKSWVDDFHTALDMVQTATGLNLKEFRIAQLDLHKETSGGNYLTGEVDYSGRTVIERSRFLLKVDAVFELLSISEEQTGKGLNWIWQELVLDWVPGRARVRHIYNECVRGRSSDG